MGICRDELAFLDAGLLVGGRFEPDQHPAAGSIGRLSLGVYGCTDAAALRRADAGLRALGRTIPPREPQAMELAARELLAGTFHADAGRALHAAAGLHEAALLLRRHGRALRFYGVTRT